MKPRLLPLPKPTKNGRHRVFIIESEAGWGQRVDATLGFKTSKQAETYVERYNARYNPPGPTPSWYMLAQLANGGFSR